MSTPKFPLGQTVSTPGALALLEEAGLSPSWFLKRHISGDWGDVMDPSENDVALAEGMRILSVYDTAKGSVWILTEYDRSVTTLLLPSEY